MRSRGFTLIEVLIAFSILAVVIAAAFAGIGSGLSQERAADATVARILAARSVLEGLGVEAPLAEGLVEGQLPTGEPWQASIQRFDQERNGPGAERTALYLVELTVFDGDRAVLDLATLSLGP